MGDARRRSPAPAKRSTHVDVAPVVGVAGGLPVCSAGYKPSPERGDADSPYNNGASVAIEISEGAAAGGPRGLVLSGDAD